MDFENELVAHRKIDFPQIAITEPNRPESNVVDFRTIEIAMLKRTIDKRDADEIARRKIAMAERTAFKLPEVELIAAENLAVILYLGKIFSHLWVSIPKIGKSTSILSNDCETGAKFIWRKNLILRDIYKPAEWNRQTTNSSPKAFSEKIRH